MKTLCPITSAREKVLSLLDSDRSAMREALIGGEQSSDDAKLVHLSIHAGHVAAFIKDDDWLFCHLVKVYGFTAGWIMKLGVQHVQTAINAERDRQDELFRTGKILYNCASRTVDPSRKLRVLIEEIGEVAEAIDMLEQTKSRRHATGDHFCTELIQVAAVSVAWLESI